MWIINIGLINQINIKIINMPNVIENLNIIIILPNNYI